MTAYTHIEIQAKPYQLRNKTVEFIRAVAKYLFIPCEIINVSTDRKNQGKRVSATYQDRITRVTFTKEIKTITDALYFIKDLIHMTRTFPIGNRRLVEVVEILSAIQTERTHIVNATEYLNEHSTNRMSGYIDNNPLSTLYDAHILYRNSDTAMIVGYGPSNKSTTGEFDYIFDDNTLIKDIHVITVAVEPSRGLYGNKEAKVTIRTPFLKDEDTIDRIGVFIEDKLYDAIYEEVKENSYCYSYLYNRYDYNHEGMYIQFSITNMTPSLARTIFELMDTTLKSCKKCFDI